MKGTMDTLGEGTSLLQQLLEPLPRLTVPVQSTVGSTCSAAMENNSSNKLGVEDRPWVCEQCSFPFKYKNNLIEHIKFYHMKGSVPCTECAQVFPTSKDLRLHRKNHSQEQGRCPHCRCVLSGSSDGAEVYQEKYKRHLPACRRCPGKMSLRMKSSMTNSESTGEEGIGGCRAFDEMGEYEAYDCQGRDSSDFCIDTIVFTEATNFEHINNLEQITPDVESVPNQVLEIYPTRDHMCGGHRVVLPEIDITPTTCIDAFREEKIIREEPITSSTSKIDFNFLCIICGVNFENEEKLNSHLYESHQSCDQDLVKRNSDSISTVPEPEVSKAISSCELCKKNFSDVNSMKEHQKECAVPADEPEASGNIEKVCAAEKVDCDMKNDDNTDLHIIYWVCKHCKQVFSNKDEMRLHKKHCSENKGRVSTPKSGSSSDLACLQCDNCNKQFDNEHELHFHKQKCEHVSEPCPLEVIVQWLCKYCKVSFPNKDEMKAHKMVCALEHNLIKTYHPMELMVKWVCKFCKTNFESRKSMQLHKQDCVLKNKDKSILSSTESDMSEVLSKDIEPSNDNKNRVMVTTRTDSSSCNTVVLRDLSVDAGQPQKDFCQKEMENNARVIDITSENECSLDGVVVPDNNLNKTKSQPVVESDINLKSNNLLDSAAVSDQQQDILVKWVCKYCKLVFENRNLMHAHKKTCELSGTIKVCLPSIECVGKQDIASKEEPQPKKRNALAVSLEKSSSTDLNSETNYDDDEPVSSDNEDNTRGNPHLPLKIKIKLNHRCNICAQTFPLRQLMKTHKLEHMFKCMKCGRYLKSQAMLWKHTRLCRAQKPSAENKKCKVYSCKGCYRVFREKYKFRLHKGCCQRQNAKNAEDATEINKTLLAQTWSLRIRCNLCRAWYVGNDIFNRHSCGNKNAVDVFLDCTCGLTPFSNISAFYSHLTSCTVHCMSDLASESQLQRASRLMCHSCHMQFDTIFFYYRHLLTHTTCRRTCRNKRSSSFPSNMNTEEMSDEEKGDWTCSFCKFIISSAIPKSKHYELCKSKMCHKCGYFTEKARLLLTHDCNEGFQYMASARVLLYRLPPSLLQELHCEKQTQPEVSSPVADMKQTTVQKCVICHKKCRFTGTGLPPIGQLECFQCRGKIHRKDLKKQGEMFYSRCIFEDNDSKSVGQIHGQMSYMPSYLDPSKRLKLSRALSKVKQSSQGNTLQDTQGELAVPNAPRMLSSVCSNTKQKSKNLVEKCSHCKRGFSSRGEFLKHVELSKTCRHTESTKVNSRNEELYLREVSVSPIINFVDFITNVPNSVHLMSSSSVESSEHAETSSYISSSCSTFSESLNSFSSSKHQNDCNLSDHAYATENDKAVFLKKDGSKVVKVPVKSRQDPSQQTTRTFLVLEDAQKALSSRAVPNRVPIGPSLQCDGWILNSKQGVQVGGTSKTKLICGACYKSFPDEKNFSDHVSTVHKLSEDSTTKLLVMKHIPNEVLNKVSW